LNDDFNSAGGRHLPIKDRNLDAALGRCSPFIRKRWQSDASALLPDDVAFHAASAYLGSTNHLLVATGNHVEGFP
jgi:hypothetical protein